MTKETLLERKVTQEMVNAYADSSGDYNPIHIDPDFARKSPFGGTIAHGMLVLAFVQQALAREYGPHSICNLKARFKLPAKTGEIVKVVLDKEKMEFEVQDVEEQALITGRYGIKVD